MPDLQIRLLGAPEVLLDWAPVTFARRRTMALLAFLAVTGNPQPRESLMALLTTEHVGERASKLLSNSLTELRQHLGDYIESDRRSISLSTELPYLLDTRELEAGVPALAEEFDAEAVARWMSLYRGDFLDGLSLEGAAEFEEWYMQEAERLRATYVRGLRAIASASLEAQDYETGLKAVDRLRALEPWDEEAVRQRMLLRVRAGERLHALADYERYREQLRDELEAVPEARTTQIYLSIRAGATLPPNNLPAVSQIVGRRREVAELTTLLADEDARVTNLVGLAGIGKTRLALEAALHYAAGLFAHEQPFSDGVYFVALDEASEVLPRPGSLAAQICTQIGVHVGAEPAEEVLLTTLHDKSALLVLDGVNDGDEQVRELLRRLSAATRVKFLVTSRRRLDLPSDYVVEVDGLDCPSEPGEAESSDAGRLFLREAARHAIRFDPTESDREQLVRLCRLTGGHPRALAIAAELAKTMGIAEIADGIEAGGDFLRSEERGASHSVRDELREAWEQVPGRAQAALRRLSVIRSTFDAESASAVADVSHTDLAILRDASLISCPAAAVCQVPPLVRQFVGEHSPLEAEQLGELRARHAAHYTKVFVRRTYALAGRPNGSPSKSPTDLDDVVAAVRWAATTPRFDLLAEVLVVLPLWSEVTGRTLEALELYDTIESSLGELTERLPEDPLLPLFHLSSRVGVSTQLVRLGEREAAAMLVPPASEPEPRTSSRELAADRHITLGECALRRHDVAAAVRHFASVLREESSRQHPVVAAMSTARLGTALWLGRALPEATVEPPESNVARQLPLSG